MRRAQRGRSLKTLPYSLALLGLVLIVLAVFNRLWQDLQPTKTSVDAPVQSWTATDRLVERLQERIGSQPKDTEAYVQLGGAYLQKARETGDLSYYG